MRVVTVFYVTVSYYFLVNKMNTILDIADAVLEKIARKLKIDALRNFRLTCKRFYSATLSKSILENIEVDLTRLEENDLENAFFFLEKIGYGRFVHLILTVAVGEDYETYKKSWSKPNAEKIITFAKNLNSFQGDISLTEYISCRCPYLKSLILVSSRQSNSFLSLSGVFITYLISLKKFEYLEELHIWRIRNLPISSLDVILDNTVNLIKLEFVSVDFTWDDRANVEYILFKGIRQNAVIVKADTVIHWVFKHVDTEGLKIILPTTTESLVKDNSPNISWNSIATRLKKLSMKLEESEFFFPPNVENLSLDASLTNWSITNLMNLRNINDYASFTLYTCVTSEVIDKLVGKVRIMGISTLSKIHLNHCRKKHSSDCIDDDIAKLFSFFKKVEILVLENFDEITSKLIDRLYHMNLKLKLLRLINCKGFKSDEVTCVMTNKYSIFKIDIINGDNEDLGRIHEEPTEVRSIF